MKTYSSTSSALTTGNDTALDKRERDLLHWFLVYNDLDRAAEIAGFSDDERQSGMPETIFHSTRFKREYGKRRDARKRALDIDEGWLYQAAVKLINEGGSPAANALKIVAQMRGFLVEKKEIRQVPELDMAKLYKMDDAELATHLLGMLQNMLPEDKRVVIEQVPQQLECVSCGDAEPEEEEDYLDEDRT